MPQNEESFYSLWLRGAKVFTTLDLRSGYYNIELGMESWAKMAFVTPFGKYEFNMVLFGLAQAPAYFQTLINKVLKGLHKFAVTYLDDIIIFSKTEKEPLKHLRIIFQRLKEASLKLKRSKCDFMKKKNPIPWTPHIIRWNTATTQETWEHQGHASTSELKRSQTVPRSSRVLSQIYTPVLWSFKTPGHGRMYYLNGPRNVKHVLNCWRKHTSHITVSWSR